MSISEKLPPDDGDPGAEGARWKRLKRRAEKMVADPHNVATLRQIRPNPLAAAPAPVPMPAAPGPRTPGIEQREDEKTRVLAVVQRLQSSLNRKAGAKRNWGAISALVCILAPTLLAAVFYIFFASELYVSEARFAVRTSEEQATDALGTLAGLPSSSVVSDSYIVSDYILSRDMITELERRIPLRQMFAHPDADFLRQLDPTVTLDELVEYWSHRVDVYYDFTKSTIAVRVQAFSAADSEKIAGQIVDVVRNLVNSLSAQARRDAVGFASGELARAELRVRKARDDLISFRSKNNNFDPAGMASAAVGIVGSLESERSQLNSQLAAVSAYLGPSAPSVQILKSRIAALEAEIGRIQGEISDGKQIAGGVARAVDALPSAGALSTVVADYQELLLSQEFAEKAYTGALGSLERARSEADRNQSYLALYMQPNAPERAAYPLRVQNIFLVLILASVLWAIGALAFLTARDHVT